MIKAFLSYMKTQGWNIEMNENPVCKLPEPMKSRYESYPPKWLEFITAVKSMESGDERAWFLCEEDYEIQGDKAWQWNEWELRSLEAAQGDEAWKQEIKTFWDMHLPIVISLREGYSYYAISIKDGSIVYGFEPEFEECRKAADSFTDFMQKIMAGKIRI